jgi:hypothetical protein
MAKVFLVCEQANLTFVDGYPACTQWELQQPTFPMYELEPADLAAIMGATTLFLAICYGGRGLLKFLFTSASSND